MDSAWGRLKTGIELSNPAISIGGDTDDTRRKRIAKRKLQPRA
jgi:hypothetical protein